MYNKFKASDLLFKDYKWQAKADHDNPKIIGGNDHNQLNRTEGYEMLYYIKSLGTTWKWPETEIAAGQRLEKIIKEVVPTNIRTHSAIKEWISEHYKTI
jgi:hypothetical protein